MKNKIIILSLLLILLIPLNIYAMCECDIFIDNESDLETLWGGVNVLLETEIDASSELAAIMDDEVGSGTGALLMFNIAPYIHNGSTGPGSILFREDSDNGTNTVQLIGPSSTADVVQTLQAVTGTIALSADIAATKLDDFASPEDNTDLNVSTSAHGLCPKAPATNQQSLSGLTGAWAVDREFSKLNMTNGDTQTEITEAQHLANKTISNQGDTVETDILLKALSYTIDHILEVDEDLIMEICPPSGETLWLDGDTSSLDANDCVDSPATQGSMAALKRVQDSSGTWHWHIIASIGNWVDAGATD